jgi:hypothetical protein
VERARSTALHHQDELSLVELWQALERRKFRVLLSIVIAVGLAFAYAALQKPVYDASVKIQIGQVAGSGLFESADLLALRLMAEYGQDVADGVKRERPLLKQASPPRGIASILELVTEGYTPEDATRMLERISADGKHRHDERFEESARHLKERIRHIELQRASLNEQYDAAVRLKERLREQDAVQAALIVQERARISTLLSTLDTERVDLERRLTPPQTQKTELLGQITAPIRPAAPRKVLIVAIGAILGLLIGTMLAFVADSAHRRRTHDGNPV